MVLSISPAPASETPYDLARYKADHSVLAWQPDGWGAGLAVAFACALTDTANRMELMEVLTPEDLDCAAEIAKTCNSWVLSDEIYSRPPAL